MILALAACNQQPAQYNVRADLPSGGEEIKAEEAPEGERSDYEAGLDAFSQALANTFNQDAYQIDLNVNLSAKDIPVDSEGKVKASANLNANVGVSLLLPVGERKYSAAKIDVKNLTISVNNVPTSYDEEGKPVYSNYNYSGLKFSAIYQVVPETGDGRRTGDVAYLYLDVSDASIKGVLKEVYDQFIGSMSQVSTLTLRDPDEDPTGAPAIPTFDELIGSGKLYLNLTQVLALVASSESAPEELKNLPVDVLGYFVSTGFSTAKGYAPAFGSAILSFLGNNLPFFKQWKGSDGEVNRMGLSVELDVVKMINDMSQPVADDARRMAVPSTGEVSEETNPTEMFDRCRAGAAIVVGSTTGSKNGMALEYAEVKADVAIKESATIQGGVRLDFKYNDQVSYAPLDAAGIAAYDVDALLIASQLMPVQG